MGVCRVGSVVAGRCGVSPRHSHEVPRPPPPQVQLHLVEMIKAKKSGAGHKMYKVCRRVLNGPIVAEDTYCLEVVGKELRGEGERNAQGQREGRGTLVMSSGDMYEGQWLAGRYHGQGRSTSCTGDVYEGEFQTDDYHGRGKMTFAGGGSYDGEFQRGLFHGRGKLTDAGGDVYDGEWADGEQHGIATFTYADGSVMVGCFEADAVVGQGVHWSMDRMTALELQAGAAVRGIPLDEAAKITERIGLLPPWEAEHSTVIERYDLRLRDLYGVVTM